MTPKDKQLQEVKENYEAGVSHYFELDNRIQVLLEQVALTRQQLSMCAFENKVFETQISYLMGDAEATVG